MKTKFKVGDYVKNVSPGGLAAWTPSNGMIGRITKVKLAVVDAETAYGPQVFRIPDLVASSELEYLMQEPDTESFFGVTRHAYNQWHSGYSVTVTPNLNTVIKGVTDDNEE